MNFFRYPSCGLMICMLAVFGVLLSDRDAETLAQEAPLVGPATMSSWNDTSARQALVAFVEKVTRPGSPDFVPPAERIAVFDNDGTLWPENPVPVQLAYALDAVKQLVAEKPELEKDPMVQAAIRGDLARLLEGRITMAS